MGIRIRCRLGSDNVSIREKARRLKEKQTKQQETSQEIPEVRPEETPVTSVTDVANKSTPRELTAAEIFAMELPKWIKKPWMYVQPKHAGQLQSWLDSWSNLILDYCRIFKLHIITVSEIGNEHPFSNKLNNRELSRAQLRTIVNKMVEEGLVKWLDANQIRARVFYKTTDEWADAIYEYMMSTGKAAEVITLFELVNMEQEWSNLPREEIQEIFDKFVAANKATYVTTEKDAIEFII